FLVTGVQTCALPICIAIVTSDQQDDQSASLAPFAAHIARNGAVPVQERLLLARVEQHATGEKHRARDHGGSGKRLRVQACHRSSSWLSRRDRLQSTKGISRQGRNRKYV